MSDDNHVEKWVIYERLWKVRFYVPAPNEGQTFIYEKEGQNIIFNPKYFFLKSTHCARLLKIHHSNNFVQIMQTFWKHFSWQKSSDCQEKFHWEQFQATPY